MNTNLYRLVIHSCEPNDHLCCHRSIRLTLDEINPVWYKQYYDLLWRVLGCLPPSIDYLDRLSTYTHSAHLLHSIRLEKMILREKSTIDFLGKDLHVSDVDQCRSIDTNELSLFDLLVYQIRLRHLSPSMDDIHRFYRLFLHEFQLSLNIDLYWQYLSCIPINKSSSETSKCLPLPSLPVEYDELLKYQLNVYFEQTNLRSIFIGEILQILVQLHPTIDDKHLYIEMQLNCNLEFVKEQIKLANINAETIKDDIHEYIYRQIFHILFESTVPNAIITDDVYHDLLKYLDEQFHVDIFQRCLSPHDLFDLLYLTANDRLSLAVFARMLMLFNRIFSYSSSLSMLIPSLNRLTTLSHEQLKHWLSKLVQPKLTDRSTVYTPEQFKHILEIFTKYFIKKNDDGTTIINEHVSSTLLTILVELGDELLQTTAHAIGLPQIIQLLVILAGHGSGNGHRQLCAIANKWLVQCAERLQTNVE
jgi:hypothetical protein